MRSSFMAGLSAAAVLGAATLLVATDMTSAAEALTPGQTAVMLPRIEAEPLADDQDLSLGTARQNAHVAAVDGNAPTALQDPPATSLAALVDREADDVDALDPQERCLASAIFYEARAESLAGKLAVARVIINRSKSGRFADSICGVITQRGQFSFVRGGQIPGVPESSRQWPNSVAVARIALKNEWKSQAEGALFFHARHVSPAWGKRQLAQVDNHIFYR